MTPYIYHKWYLLIFFVVHNDIPTIMFTSQLLREDTSGLKILLKLGRANILNSMNGFNFINKKYWRSGMEHDYVIFGWGTIGLCCAIEEAVGHILWRRSDFHRSGSVGIGWGRDGLEQGHLWWWNYSDATTELQLVVRQLHRKTTLLCEAELANHNNGLPSPDL